jgi:uncharacterized repeat protein (TIGR01451 family)
MSGRRSGPSGAAAWLLVMRKLFAQFSTRVIGLAVALVAAHGPVFAEQITNTAQITWTSGTSTVGRNSNRVDIQVVRETPGPETPVLSTHQLVGSAGGGSPISIPTTMCQSSSGARSITLDGAFAGTNLSPAQTRPSNVIRAGEPLVVAVDSRADNRNPTLVETLNVTLETPSGDSEYITLTETGANTARFVGIIRTVGTPPSPVRGDCVLSVRPGDTLNLSGLRSSDNSLIDTTPVEILIDPFGIVFDSGDGAPIAGSRVTLINVATGQPADVFGDDGVSRFPSSVITGSTVTDASGAIYAFPPGDYRFPFARAGQYRLLVEPPAPYSGPSTASPADLAGLRRPDGPAYTIVDGSFGRVFTLNDPAPVRIDIPVDRPGGALILTKAASQSIVQTGDALQYRITVANSDAVRSTGAITVTDVLPIEMRLRQNSVRYNGDRTAFSITPDGRTLTIPVAPLRPNGSGIITYLLEVRPDARAGTSLNRATARDGRGLSSNTADASVKIVNDGISERITIIGRITEGGCTLDPNKAKGIANVRVTLENGTYTVTDEAGRYHFEGVLPGLHVVQMDPASLPADQVPVDCSRNARTAGSAISRFVEGRGGSLLRADFRAIAGQNAARSNAKPFIRPAIASDSDAAGSNQDWFADQTPEVKWLYPSVSHNPRSKSVRVAIKHLAGQTVKLFANGKAVAGVAYEGARKNGDGTLAVSIWRGLDLPAQDTVFKAEVSDETGKIVQTLERPVHFASAPIRAEFVKSRSLLVADGVTRPVIAVRMLDRAGRPVHHGVVGDFAVPTPYYPAVEADAQDARQLSGLERARPVWRVDGDEGIAYIELEPTTASGGLTITLPLRDGDVTREQQVDLWLTPGDRAWTVVGFAAGTVGYNTLESNAEEIADTRKDVLTDGRIALYAKGRVKGQWLMTLAYDSDKRERETRFAGIIDPASYYTIYADRSEQRPDAASVRKLYLRLERPQFFALFGDYETGLSDTTLANYVRSFNGVKSQFQNETVSATAFAADTPFRHRREEIQGTGLTGPYQLSVRDVLPNSERIVIETRDRLRSERIVENRALIRHIDYDIDYAAGTLRFREPILSRSSGFDPQFIIADYEVDGVAQRVVNAGGRVTVQNKAKTLKVGGSFIHDETEQANTNLGALDATYRPNANTEIRGEFAVSDGKAKAGNTTDTAGTSTAWLIEAEHHSEKLDLLGYVREQQSGYGVGQTNSSENGTLKFGVDGRLRFTPNLSLTASAYQEDYLNSAAKRQAGKLLAEYRAKDLDLRAGFTLAHDQLADGREASSQIAQLGATKRLFDNKLELDAQTEFALNSSESVDFPSRHRVGARYKFTDDLSVIGSYELASGENVDARTARIGFDLAPWRGARLVASANQQDIDEYGPRSFAAYGLAQSLPVSEKITVDFTLDGNKTIGGISPSRVLNRDQPVASGGFIGTDRTLTEDFTAVTTGATYRGERWSIASRAEYRDGTTTNRHGLTLAALRQIGEGKAFGGQLSWFKANQNGGPKTENAALALSWANRPDTSRFAFLEKLELRMDKVTGGVAGQSGPIGGAPLLLTGNAVSKRIINSLSVNWSPRDRNEDGEYLTRSEVSLFWGSRYVFDRIEQDELKGWSNLFGADIRFDLGKHADIGVSGTVRVNPGARSKAFSGGPVLGIAPAKNTYVSVGYNVIGFRDKDFRESRYTQSGPFVTLRLKFDQESLGFLGLAKK